MGKVVVELVGLGAWPKAVDGEGLSDFMGYYLSHLLYCTSSQLPFLRQNPPSQVAAKVPEKGRFALVTLGMLFCE